MDRIETTNTNAIQKQEPPKITRKIGGTTYEVSIHFSTTSKESMADKIMRLIQRDIAEM